MRSRSWIRVPAMLASGLTLGFFARALARAQAQPSAPGGYVLERDTEIALNEPGTHDGGGETIGYSFFTKVPRLGLVFRKRAFKPGAAIGYHLQDEDEIYYVLSGRGVMTIDGKSFEVDAGTAILTRAGSSHGLKQTGSEDLVILINHESLPGTSSPGPPLAVPRGGPVAPLRSGEARLWRALRQPSRSA